MQRPVVVPRSLLPSVTTRRTLMGLIGSDARLLIVTWSSSRRSVRSLACRDRSCCFRWCGRQLSLRNMPISGVDPTPRPAAVYASNAALPRRPQDSLPSCLLGFGRTRLALASSHQLLLSHPASGFPTGFIARHTAADQDARVEGAARRTLRTPDGRRTASYRALAPCAACAGTRERGRRRDCRPPDRPACAFRSRSKPTSRAEVCSADGTPEATVPCCRTPGDHPPSP